MKTRGHNTREDRESSDKPQTVIQDKNIMGVFGRSYLLNKGLIMMSYCHADVLAHKATLKRLGQLNQTSMGSKSLRERKLGNL